MIPLSLYQPETSELRAQCLKPSQAECEVSVSSNTEVFPQIFQWDLRPGYY